MYGRGTVGRAEPEEVRHGQKVINELITCSMFSMEIQPDADSSMYPDLSSF